jgi:hypothetical protein
VQVAILFRGRAEACHAKLQLEVCEKPATCENLGIVTVNE